MTILNKKPESKVDYANTMYRCRNSMGEAMTFVLKGIKALMGKKDICVVIELMATTNIPTIVV